MLPILLPLMFIYNALQRMRRDRIDAGRVMFFRFTAIASHVYVHVAVVMRAQGRRIDEIPEGGACGCNVVVLVYDILQGEDLVNVASDAALGSVCVQFRERRGFQGKEGYVFESGM